MESSAYKWLVSQYRFVLNRMRAHEFMEEHPSCAAASRPRSAAAFIAPRLRLEQLENRVMLATNVTGIPNWAEQGPGPMTGGQVRGIANQPVTGAIHSVAADPDVAQAGTIWVGTVGGGIWKTTNGGTTWTPKTDQFPSTAISAIALDPVNNNVVWAGTGKVSSSGLGGKTIGLLKSSDGGETWKIFPSIFERNRTIHAIVPTTVAQGSGRVVLIGSDATAQFTGAPAARVSGGLVRSTDGGFGGFKKISGNHNDGLDNDSDGTKDEADENTGLPGGTVTDIKGDPTDPNRFYAAMPGIGIFMSTDAGATWTQLNTALATAGANVTASTKIELAVSGATAANGNHPIYAAMIQEVQDNLIGARPAPNQVDVSLNTLITNGDTVWIYNAAGQAIDNRQVIATATVGGNTRLTFASNLTVAHTPGAFIWRGGMRIAGMFRSDDHGATWRSMGRPGDANGGIHPGAQAENHLSIIADRNNANIVYVGGDRQVALPGADGVLNTPDDTFGAGNAAGATNYTGRLFRGTFAPGPNTTAWGSITDNNATGGGAPAAGTGPHADSRAMVYDANGDILEVDDGGIYKLVNPGANQIWQSINGNLRLTEFYSVAWNATTSQILGGTQDNGVAYQSGPNNLSWGNLSQGDGAIVASSNGVNYYSSQNFGGFKIGAASPALRVAGTGPAASRMALGKFDTTVQFVQPYVVNAAANNRVLIGTSYLYETNAVGSNLGDLLTPLGGNPLANGATFAPNPTAFIGKVRPNAMVYGGFQGATPMPDVGWVGTDGDAASNFLFIRQAGANTPFVPVVSWRSAVAGQKAPNTRVVAVAVDPTDWRHVYVLDASGRIWFSDDGAKNPALQMDNSTAANWQWTELTKQTNNLLTLPGATNLQDIAIHRTATRRVILVGGDGGLFRRVDNLTLPANGNWHEYGGGPTVNGVATPNGGGLPNAMVSDIEFTTNNQVLVGTMGRGAFTAPTADLINPGLVSITGTAGADVLKLRRDAARPWLLNIYEYLVGNAEPAAATTVVPLASINSILIDGGAGNDQIVVDYSNGAISVPDGITVIGGDDTDSLSLPVPTVARRKATSKKTSNLGPLFQSTITSKDSFGVEGKQMVFWSTLTVETPPGATQIASAINTVGSGLQTASNSLQHGLGSVAGGTALAGLNAQSLTAGLNGVRINQPRPKDDAFLSVSEVNDSNKVQLDNATSVLRRLIEEGLNGFHLNDIDEEEGTITDLDALKDALDALDGTAGNVTLNTTTNDNDGDGTMDPTFTVQILNRPLDGIVNLDVNAMSALGEIQLGGALEVTADVTLNVVFGVDAEGFFLKPSAAGTPAIRLSNFEIDGAVS
ncbi:MAG: hypothetical protein QOE14_837, partial [Humisphaera sp.]|nr:hypothetical protein [Humisphaera sp.]